MIRKSIIAGQFYESDPVELRRSVENCLALASDEDLDNVKGLIVPHAGISYSGKVAAAGYKQILNLALSQHQVFILAPAHSETIGVSIGNYEAYETPLGNVPVNQETTNKLLADNPELVSFKPEAHQNEHSIEIQLPFLQRVLKDFNIVPILIGQTDTEALTRMLNPYWQDTKSIFIFSTDLSHYHPAFEALQIDENSLSIINNLELIRENEIDACGREVLKIAMRLIKNNNNPLRFLRYQHSGDITGDNSAVVGYTSWAISQS
jgi:AmmeMemoRadiSam system protein B